MYKLVRTASFILLAMIVSCKTGDDGVTEERGNGFLQLFELSSRLIVDEEDFSGGRTMSNDVNAFVVEIIRVSDNQVVQSWENYSEVPASIPLASDSYFVRAYNDDFPSIGASFDFPYFLGESSPFTIEFEETTTIDPVVATPANTKVTVVYSSNVQSFFDSYSVTVISSKGDETLSFGETETRSGYFTSGFDLDISGTLTYAQTDGTSVDKTVSSTISNAEIGKNYVLNVDAVLENGEVVFQVNLDDSFTDEVIDIGLGNSTAGWTLATANAPWEARRYHTSLVYDNKIWVIGGSDNQGNFLDDAWYSVDGINWTQATDNAFTNRDAHSSVVFDNNMWVLGGYNSSQGNRNDVLSSSDGANWSQFPSLWNERSSHASISFDNKIFVIGGNASDANDVWYSTNGTSWTADPTPPSWVVNGRHSFPLIELDNKVWALGGIDNQGNQKNDIWNSSDGLNWASINPSAAWSGRFEHTSLIYNNKIWVIAGYSGVSPLNEVWTSTDGIGWAQETNGSFAGRSGQTGVVFDGKIWIIGGRDNSNQNLNDIWYYQE